MRPRRHLSLRSFKEVKIGETFRFVNSVRDFVKISPRRYKEVGTEEEEKIYLVGTIHAKVE